MIFGALGASPLGDDGVFSVGTAYVLTADVGLFSLAGQDAALPVERRLTGDFGAFSFTGQDAALPVERRLTGDVGLFALAGQDAALRMARQLMAEAGVFTVAGQDVAFIVSTFSGAVFMRFARRKAVLARPGHAAAITGAQQTAQAVRARLTIRGDDRL